MARSCRICNHPKRLEIDKELVTGKSKTEIARNFDVPYHSLEYHEKSHLSRQLAQAMNKKQGIEGLNLLEQLEEIITKAKQIFDRNYANGKDDIALRALAEQRGTLDLLCRIAQTLYSIKALEMHQTQREETEALDLSDFTDDELRFMITIGMKLNGEEPPPTWATSPEFPDFTKVDLEATHPPKRIPCKSPPPVPEQEVPPQVPPQETPPKTLPSAPTKTIPGKGGLRRSQW